MILRSAYDPVVAGALERHGDLGRDLATAGPVAVTESWSSVRSDSAHHCVLWISEWPRSLVYPGFLAPVLLSSGVRRTFTLLYWAYDHVRKCVGFVRWHEGDADQIAPSLYAGRTRSSSEVPAAPVAPATPVRPGMPGADPFDPNAR